jgi:hypothetical protein
MIIAISGKIGSGKDTVGKIIQYLTYTKNNRMSFSSFCLLEERWYNSNDWQIKKFADKLKDIVCLLTGCTREQLEDQEFKNIELGEEWKVSRLVLGSNYGVSYRYFNNLQEAKDSSNRCHNFEINKVEEYVLTYRSLLQLLGTECGRDIIHPNIWCNSLFSEYLPAVTYQMEMLDLGASDLQREKIGKPIHSEYPNWCITDMRFPNELEAVKNRDGISIRVKRPKTITVKDWDNLCPCCGQHQQEGKDLDSSHNWLLTYNCYKCKSTYKINFGDKSDRGFDVISVIKDTTVQEHESETAFDDATFDWEIDNSGNIEELIEKVREILIKEKII